jgi:hypothetical protein
MTLRLPLFIASCVLVSFLPAQNNPGIGPITEARFDVMEHDFGQVLQDSENPHVFTFKNTGDVALIITDAIGSCGCTVPSFPKDPILPGEEGEISVVYKPGKQEGHQVKTVTISANTKPAQTLLRIHAEVFTHDPRSASEPYTFEPLPPLAEQAVAPFSTEDPLAFEAAQEGPTTAVLFETYAHDFGQILQGSENPQVFTFKNSGDVPLIITNATGSCGCTVPFYAKDPIMPGEESEIHVVYKPGKQEGNQSKTVTITANTEPAQTMLRITAEVLVVDSLTYPSLLAVDEEHEKDRTAIDAVSPGCFVLYPNPTSNELRLDLKEHIGRAAQVHIHDGTGKEMLQTNIAAISSETSRLDVSSFPAGIYIITIQVERAQPMSQCFVVSD